MTATQPQERPTPIVEPKQEMVPQDLPGGTLHMQTWLATLGLKGHRRKIIGYLEAPNNKLRHHAYPKPNRPGEHDRYLTLDQQEALLEWLHTYHPEVFGPGSEE